MVQENSKDTEFHKVLVNGRTDNKTKKQDLEDRTLMKSKHDVTNQNRKESTRKKNKLKDMNCDSVKETERKNKASHYIGFLNMFHIPIIHLFVDGGSTNIRIFSIALRSTIVDYVQPVIPVSTMSLHLILTQNISTD